MVSKNQNGRYFLSIDNSIGVLHKINFTHKKIQVFDFENLFNNSPIDFLYSVLKNIFYLFYIKDELEINMDIFLCPCDFCFYNNYITFNNVIFKQLSEIGMSIRVLQKFFFFFIMNKKNYSVNYNKH